MFITAVIIIVLISIAWALWSLQSLKPNRKEIEHAKSQLKKGRVIFHRDDSSSSSS